MTVSAIATHTSFWNELEQRIAKYDLLCHPFYKAWAAGELTRQDLQEYAQHYYHHVEAFPTYLAQFGIRLEEGELRRAVLANMSDEKGGEDGGADAFGEEPREERATDGTVRGLADADQRPREQQLAVACCEGVGNLARADQAGDEFSAEDLGVGWHRADDERVH